MVILELLTVSRRACAVMMFTPRSSINFTLSAREHATGTFSMHLNMNLLNSPTIMCSVPSL